jgi:hypothetical protein
MSDRTTTDIERNGVRNELWIRLQNEIVEQTFERNGKINFEMKYWIGVITLTLARDQGKGAASVRAYK